MYGFSFVQKNRRDLSPSTEGSSFPSFRSRWRARSSHPSGGWARHISRARRSAMGVVAGEVRSDRGSGWLWGDRWAAAEVAVRAVVAVGPGTMLLLRLRGAGPCPPSRGHTTGAGRRVRGAGADADAAGPGPRRSIPSPAAFWRGHYRRNCSTRCRCWAGSSWVWCATTRSRVSWCRGTCRLKQTSATKGTGVVIFRCQTCWGLSID